jgi:sensor histidine kinase YesM
MTENLTVAELENKLQNYTDATEDRVNVLVQLVAIYLNTDLEKSKILIDEAEEISLQLNYHEGVGLSCHQRGVYYYLCNDFENALIHYLNADTILSKSKHWRNKIKPKANIAMVYIHTHQYNEALRIYKEIEDEIQSVPVELTHAQMYINIDAAYCYLNDPENGIIYSKKALEISQQLNSRYGIALSESNIAGHLVLLNKHEEALPHLVLSEEMCNADGYSTIQVGNYLKYTDCYLHLRQFKTALEYANKGISQAQKVQDIEKEVWITKHIIEIYEQQQDFKNALSASKSYIELKEKMLNNDKIKSFNALQIKYETEKKEAALNQLKLEQTQSELTALKSQMNPHFIFNALNSIQELYTIGDKKTANEQMANFASLTRKILDVSGKQKIDLADEIDILTKYLELESIRFENDFSYKINLTDNIDEDYLQLPPMLIQPFVENAIKHGLLHKKEAKQLNINFILNDDETILICEIIDNGIGRQASAAINANRSKSHVSFATSATQKRLDLLNKNKEVIVSVVYEDVKDEWQKIAGTKVIVRIPV